jgi:hypothetical protein
VKFGKILEFFIEHPISWFELSMIRNYIGSETFELCRGKETLDAYTTLGYLKVSGVGGGTVRYCLDLRSEKIQNFFEVLMNSHKFEINEIIRNQESD